MACDFFNETAPEPNDRPTTSEAFWGITLEDGGSDLGDDQEYSSQHFYKHKHKQQPQREAPLAALHAATSVPLADLKEACAIFERFAQVDSEACRVGESGMEWIERPVDLDRPKNTPESAAPPEPPRSLLCHITGVQNVKELEQEFVKQAFYDHTGDIDIFEFVTWYSAFSFSEAVCVNKFARETRDVARKHGMSILNIERFAAALRVECGA
ncbi:Putative calcium-binding protein CML13, partial [Durusdinium trenchii]